MKEPQESGALKMELYKGERDFRYVTFVRCPKCNKFDIEEEVMHWH